MTKTIMHHNKINLASNQEEIFYIKHITHVQTPSGSGVQKPPIHRHSFHEIIFVTQGEGIIQIDFKDYSLKQGAICFLSPSQVHEPIETSADYKAYLLRFYPSLFDNKDFFDHITIFDSDYVVFEDANYTEINTLLERLSNEFEQDQTLKQFALGNLLKCLLISIQRRLPTTTNQILVDNLFIQLNTLIEENAFKVNTPSYYAKKLKISPRTLHTVVKKYSGLTAGDYIRSKTIFEAKRLLSYTTLNIKEIAYSLGFEDTAYFSRFFKRDTNLSPIDFRKNSL